MPIKNLKDQPIKRRKPVQARSYYKIELILDAVIQLLEKDGMGAVNTNAIAERAGVSIGTLYQYFDNKEAIISALLEREFNEMQRKILQALADEPPETPGDRIRLIVRAVLGAYNGKANVHAFLINYAWQKDRGSYMTAFNHHISEFFVTRGITGYEQVVYRLTPERSFVLIHAVAGVLRAMTTRDQGPEFQKVEDALVDMIMRFVKG